jgi:hypothetical protein
MKHFFISHASQDITIAQRLCDDLKDVGHDVCIDRQELFLGDDTIDFMNNAIVNAHTVVVVFSKNTTSAIWQKNEINAAIWNEQAQRGGKVIVVKYGEVNLPPLLGPRLYGSLDANDYKKTLQDLCTLIVASRSATTTIGEALTENSENPFWRVRAEYFEEMPALMAQAFSPPISGTFANWEEMLPCFLEGSRGTGKTMLLLSLRARILAARGLNPAVASNRSKALSDLFGVYVRLGRGAICTAGFDTADGDLNDAVGKADTVQLSDLFSQEFYLGIIESLVSELSACLKGGHIALTPAALADLSTGIAKLVVASNSDRIIDCEELLGHLAPMREKLSNFIRRKFIYRESPSVPFTHVDIDLLKRIVSVVRRCVPILGSTQFTILLDEYENLLNYQKLVVNSLVKFGPPAFSVKIARKAGTNETSATNAGQDLQESHDYTRIPLVYSVDDDADFARYLQLLDNMVRRTLASHKMKEVTLADLLPSDDSPEIPQPRVREEVLSLLQVTANEFDSWDERRRNEGFTYYREAAIYRNLYGTPGRRTKKRFSGHKELAFVSSGVIRYFQEIVGMAFHLQKGIGGAGVAAIDPENQTEAVYIVSDHNLSMLSRNIETYGESLKYFLLDLGDCLRQKLLKHSSEPEAGRIAIKDPESLYDSRYSVLSKLIHIGVKEGVFQMNEGRPGIRPKHVEDPQPVEVNIARIYAPTLQISPRLRWTTNVACGDLAGLLSPEKRRKTKSKLIDKLVGKKMASGKRPSQGNDQKTLFQEEHE